MQDVMLTKLLARISAKMFRSSESHFKFVYLLYLSVCIFKNINSIKSSLFNICTFVMKTLLDFDLCSNARSRRQIIRHAKKREMREKHRERITFSLFFFFFFFFFRRFKSFSRKLILTVDKQSAQKHNFIQYTYDMNNVDRNYEISFFTQRSTKDIFSLKRSLRDQQLTFCKILQHEVIEQDRKWLEVTIDNHLEIFDRIKSSRYRSIRSHLLFILQKDSIRHFDFLYFQTFHDDNDENVETDIRFYIKDFRSILEFETKEKNNIDWIFLERFKKRKRWIMISFFRKSFDHEIKLLKKSRTSSIISRFLQKIRSNLINIAVFRKRNTNNLCLQTLLKIIEKKNHIAIFRNQHMYIIFRMIDNRANTFWYSIALYSIKIYSMFRRYDQMIAIFAIISIVCLTFRFLLTEDHSATLFSD